MRRDTRSEDGLSIVRTLLDKRIQFHRLSESRAFGQNDIVELAVKFLLDGENLEDRQSVVDLLSRMYEYNLSV